MLVQCSECNGPMHYAMLDIDGTSLEEGFECESCGENIFSVEKDRKTIQDGEVYILPGGSPVRVVCTGREISDYQFVSFSQNGESETLEMDNGKLIEAQKISIESIQEFLEYIRPDKELLSWKKIEEVLNPDKDEEIESILSDWLSDSDFSECDICHCLQEEDECRWEGYDFVVKNNATKVQKDSCVCDLCLEDVKEEVEMI